MRTTIEIDDGVMQEVKRVAAESGRPIARVVEDALRESLARRKQRATVTQVRLTTVAGDGVLPGVDLDDSSALMDRMEHRD